MFLSAHCICQIPENFGSTKAKVSDSTIASSCEPIRREQLHTAVLSTGILSKFLKRSVTDEASEEGSIRGRADVCRPKLDNPKQKVTEASKCLHFFDKKLI